MKEGPVEIVPRDAQLAATLGDVSPRKIAKEGLVEATPEEVWPLLTSTEGITRWMCERAKIELELGGAFEVYFDEDAETGFKGSEGCRVLTFVEPRLLSFTWNAPPQLARTRGKKTWVVLELDEVGERQTRVRITHTGWPETGFAADPQWEETFSYFDAAWGRVLGGLAGYVKTTSGA